MILLANRVLQQKQGGQILLGGMDVTVNRNYFGTQVDRFVIFFFNNKKVPIFFLKL